MKFLSRAPVYCNICNKELKHKHRPKKEWNIEGFLCAECHMDKMKEFFEGTMTQNCVKCSVKKKITDLWSHDGSGKWKGCCVRIVLIKKKRISLQKKNFVAYAELN